jgi:hypothetical protein
VTQQETVLQIAKINVTLQVIDGRAKKKSHLHLWGLMIQGGERSISAEIC